MDGDIYSGQFMQRDLLDRIQAVRKEHCTGPCGQSSHVLTCRSNTDSTLREAYAKIKRLESERDQLLQNRDLLAEDNVIKLADENSELRAEVTCQQTEIQRLRKQQLSEQEEDNA